MNVSIIGSGNVAWHLAPAFDNTDFAVKEVYSRKAKHAEALAEKLYQAHVKKSLDFSDSPSQVFIIAVADDAIQEIVQEIVLPDNAILVHTSGSQPLSILEYAATPNIGVLYPLQTFSRNRKLNLKDVPFLIESKNSHCEKVLVRMAKSISKNVYSISSADRKAIHVAAVFASNFTNHMLSIAMEILNRNKLDFSLLKPLIEETIAKSLSMNPSEAQTGPARRGDLEILDKHVEFLKYDKAVAEIYRVISQHILDQYSE